MIELPHEIKRRRIVDTISAIATILISALMCCYSWSDEVSRETITADHIDKAIVHILTKGLRKHNIKPHVRHRLIKKPKLRKELVQAIDRNAKAYEVPAMFLVAVAFREGSFKNNAKGKLGESSTFQVGKGLAKRCDLSTYNGAAECAARHLRQNVDRCGSLRGSFVFYATGRTCKPDHDHLKWMDWDRWGIAEKLTKIVLSDA